MTVRLVVDRVPLEMNATHTLTASGTSNGMAVSGQILIGPTIDDMNKGYAITLAQGEIR